LNPDPKAAFRTLDELRQLAVDRVGEQSLRIVANAAEMGTESLRNFMGGGPISVKSRNSLARWLRETQRHADERAASCVGMILEVTSEVPEHWRMKAVQRVLDALRNVFQMPGIPAAQPLWLVQVLQALEAEDDTAATEAFTDSD